jgi:hypothetical protein
MHTPRALCLGLLVLSSSSLASNRSKEFCAAWTKAATTGKTYEDTLMATLEALGDVDGDWGQALRAVSQSAQGNHVAILRGGATELGETFSCPAFEFPAGPPKARAMLQGEQARGIDAMGSDGKSLYVLRTARVAGYDKAMLWEVKDKAPVRVLAEGLPPSSYNAQLVFTPSSVIFALQKEIVSVPRAGGEAKRLATGLKQPWALTVDGDGLVFIDGKELHRVPLAGGEVELLGALGDSSQQFVIAVSPEGFVVGGFIDGKVVRVSRSKEVKTLMANGGHLAFAVGADLFVHFGSDAAPAKPSSVKKFRDLGDPKPGSPPPPPPPPEGTYRLTFAAEKPERVGPWIEGQYSVVSQGNVFAFDGNQPWPGRRKLIRYKPGAASPTQVAFPVGESRQLAVDARRVYWNDTWFGAVYAEPLKP